MISKDEIENGLQTANEIGYKLFREVRDCNSLKVLSIYEHGKHMVEEIEAFAEPAAIEPSPAITFSMFKEFEKTGNRLIFENAYFKRRKQLFSIILMYILEGNKSYLPVIEEKLWEWCDLYSWELPAHFNMSADNIKKARKSRIRQLPCLQQKQDSFLRKYCQ